MKKSNSDFGKKKTWNQPSKEEGATEVVQDLERKAKHFRISKEKETESWRASWEPPQCGSKSLLQTSYLICSWEIKQQPRTRILQKEIGKYSKWGSVMNYYVFVLFLFSYLYSYHFHIVTYLSIHAVFCFSACAIKAVARQRHSPNQGTLGSWMVVKQSSLFYTTRGHQTWVLQSGNRNPVIIPSTMRS